MRPSTLFLCALLVGAWWAGATSAAPVLYDDEAAFKARLLVPKTYDFEVASGFPDASHGGFPYIGLHDNIQFDASTMFYNDPRWWPSTATMTGKNDSFASATITFNEPPHGCGFVALDLTVLDDEIIRTTVTFQRGAIETYDVRLPPGAPTFTPVFFGLVDQEDRIVSVSLYGWDSTAIHRAWLIDNLTIGADVTPAVPMTWGRAKAMWR